MGAVNSISATQSGQYLASAGHDGHVYFWNVASGMDYSIDGQNTGRFSFFKFQLGEEKRPPHYTPGVYFL